MDYTSTATPRRRSTRLSVDDRLRVSAEELKDLMEFRGAEAAKQLQEQYGGVERLCDMLATSPTDGTTIVDAGLRPGGAIHDV